MYAFKYSYRKSYAHVGTPICCYTIYELLIISIDGLPRDNDDGVLYDNAPQLQVYKRRQSDKYTAR